MFAKNEQDNTLHVWLPENDASADVDTATQLAGITEVTFPSYNIRPSATCSQGLITADPQGIGGRPCIWKAVVYPITNRLCFILNNSRCEEASDDTDHHKYYVIDPQVNYKLEIAHACYKDACQQVRPAE